MFERFLLSLELLEAHGFPVRAELHAELGWEPPIDFVQLIQSQVISPLVLNSMVGNGWVLSVAGLNLIWILSALECRRDVESFDKCNWLAEHDDGEKEDAANINEDQPGSSSKRFKTSLVKDVNDATPIVLDLD